MSKPARIVGFQCVPGWTSVEIDWIPLDPCCSQHRDLHLHVQGLASWRRKKKKMRSYKEQKTKGRGIPEVWKARDRLPSQFIFTVFSKTFCIKDDKNLNLEYYSNMQIISSILKIIEFIFLLLLLESSDWPIWILKKQMAANIPILFSHSNIRYTDDILSKTLSDVQIYILHNPFVHIPFCWTKKWLQNASIKTFMEAT